MKKIGIILALAILGAAATNAAAATYHIRSGATGNMSGADWFNAMPKLPATLVRGNTYFIADGTYPGYTFDDAQNGGWIYIKKATPASHGTSNGWQNAYGDGKAVFGPLKFTTGYYEIDGQTGGGPGKWTTGHGIKVQFTQKVNTVKLINIANAVPNLTFKHMELAFTPCSTCTGQDVVYGIKGGTNWKFQFMWMHHPSRVVFYTMGNANKIQVEYSVLERSGTNPSSSQHSEIWSARDTHDVVLRHSLIRDYRSTGGIILGRARNWNIYGNVFQWTSNFGPTANNGAVGSWSSASTYYASNIKVHNNTFVGLRAGGAGKIFPIYKSISAVSAHNNIWYNSPASGFGGGVSHANNWFMNSNEAKIPEPSKEVGKSDPFVNSAAGDFRLRAATRPGTSLGAPFNIDMAGALRGRDGIWDKGALEFGR
ncbi:hypothetical protein ARNL5_01156 [Anaerolineae bacterium]|nr:hypothetical protein ARNL5_01156 [Anaerolineae bacterium]